jgi:hypothetical protein
MARKALSEMWAVSGLAARCSHSPRPKTWSNAASPVRTEWSSAASAGPTSWSINIR